MPIYTSRDSSESHGHMELLSLLSYQKYQAHCRLVFFTCSLCLEHSLADICMDQSQPPSALCSNVIFLGRAPSLLLNGTEPSPSTYHPITTLYSPQLLPPQDIICVCVCSVVQSCLTLCDPMYCSTPGSSVHGIFQAIILEQFTISIPGIFPIQGSNLSLLSLLHQQGDSLPLSHLRSFAYSLRNTHKDT